MVHLEQNYYAVMGDSYKLALDDAKKELRDIDKLIADLSPRRERLQLLVKILEPMAQWGAGTTPVNEPEETINMFGRTEPLWMLIARAMKKYGQPFTLATAGVEVEKWSGQLLGINRPQKVRNAVIRHPEMFQKDEDSGTYTIVGEV